MSCPVDFSGDQPLGSLAYSHQQRPHLVDANRGARLASSWRVPGDPQPATAWRSRAPGVENSIVLRGEQVFVPSRQRGQRLRAKLGAVDAPSKLRLERGHTIVQLQGKRGRTDIQAVAKHHRLQTWAWRRHGHTLGEDS